MNSLLKFFYHFQNLIAKNVKIEYLNFNFVDKIAFLDCGYKKDKIKCVCVIFSKKENKIESVDEIIDTPAFPYIPTFLFLREAPFMLELIERNKADLYVIDGHGLSHPRKAGIATVVGVLKDISCIGIAKKFLFGEIREDKIFVENEIVGLKFKKYYISIGNKVDINTLREFLEFFGYEYPWPMELADKISKDFSTSPSKKLE
ncbi:MAG: endonuclease V [Candidatus Aenigmatarchaeota archaeon]